MAPKNPPKLETNMLILKPKERKQKCGWLMIMVVDVVDEVGDVRERERVRRRQEEGGCSSGARILL